jgi:outer membrane protein OmpA-like peptidoglycan-associated protein/outer membrane protein W
MKLRLALAAATCLALPALAHAQPVTGPYVSLEGGTAIENPVNGTFTALGASLGGKFMYRPSYAGIGGIGYGFGDGFRVQIDGDYIHNTISKFDFSGNQTKVVGHENKYGPMLNLLYDIPVGLPVFPYVGAGVGYQYVTAVAYNGSGVGNQIATSGTEGSFAYDVIAGLSFPVAAVPGLSLTAEYRFLMLTESYKYGFSVLGGIPTGTGGTGSVKFGQESDHIFTAGLRYSLFPPAPPPVPPAPPPVSPPVAPVVAKTYLVFFDWDKYNLTPRATQIIAEAASDSHTSATTTISVSGYTDTSGTPVYNQGLSLRRAKAVAAQLVTDGVPAGEIEIHAFGETHLLVPTGPGVREPQNRRVEIVLQ